MVWWAASSNLFISSLHWEPTKGWQTVKISHVVHAHDVMEYFLHKLHFLPEPAQLQNAVHADFVEEAAHVEHFRHEVYKLLPNA